MSGSLGRSMATREVATHNVDLAPTVNTDPETDHHLEQKLGIFFVGLFVYLLSQSLKYSDIFSRLIHLAKAAFRQTSTSRLSLSQL